MAITEYAKMVEEIEEYLERIESSHEVYNDYAENRRIAHEPGIDEVQLGTAIPMQTIQRIFLGIDCSVDGGSEVLRDPLDVVSSYIGKNLTYKGDAEVIVLGSGDNYKLSEGLTAGTYGLENLIYRYASKGSERLNITKFMEVTRIASEATEFDGYIFLLSADPDRPPTHQEKAFISDIADKLLWILPNWVPLRDDGDGMKKWDNKYTEHIVYFPKNNKEPSYKSCHLDSKNL